MKKTTLVVLLACLYGSPSFAGGKQQSYLGVHLSQVAYEDEDFAEEANPTALTGRYGYFFRDDFAAESRLGFGLGDDTAGPGVDVEVDKIYGIYALYHLRQNNLSFYGVLGLSRGDLTINQSGTSDSEDESSLSYGFGVEIKSLSFEYMMYLDQGALEVSAISLGYSHDF